MLQFTVQIDYYIILKRESRGDRLVRTTYYKAERNYSEAFIISRST